MLQQDDELGTQDQTPQSGNLQQGTVCEGPTLQPALVWPPQLHPLPSSSQPTCVVSGLLSTTGKPLWLEEVSLRMSTTVPTRSILRRQVTGVLITSLQGKLWVKRSPTAAHTKSGNHRLVWWEGRELISFQTLSMSRDTFH